METKYLKRINVTEQLSVQAAVIDSEKQDWTSTSSNQIVITKTKLVYDENIKARVEKKSFIYINDKDITELVKAISEVRKEF